MAKMLVDGLHEAIGVMAVDTDGFAHPTSDSDAMLPGDTTLTRISSLANNNERFFETLVSIDLAAV